MKRVFLDTNAVIDALLEREEYMDDVFQILSCADRKEIIVCCSALSIATASYFMERAKMPHDLLINKLDLFCQICEPTIVDSSIVKQALRSSFTDFEDAMQYYSAMKAKVDFIITRNGKDFALSKIPVMTASEYLAMTK